VSAQQKVEFVIHGKINGVEITPQTIGFSLFNQFNQEVEDFLKGNQKNLKLSEVHVRIEDGSYKLVPILTAAVLTAVAPDLQTLKQEDSLGEIDSTRAEIVTKWQKRAKYESGLTYEIKATGDLEAKVSISKTTDYHVGRVTPWVQVEKYLFGRILDMGGAKTANVHLAIEGQPKALVVDTTEDLLRDQKENRIYHRALLRVRAEQNIHTGDLRDLHLMEFADYEPRYDEAVLNNFIEAGTKAWADVPDAVAWVRELRGGS
jgi:hypothetical protein